MAEKTNTEKKEEKEEEEEDDEEDFVFPNINFSSPIIVESFQESSQQEFRNVQKFLYCFFFKDLKLFQEISSSLSLSYEIKIKNEIILFFQGDYLSIIRMREEEEELRSENLFESLFKIKYKYHRRDLSINK